MFKHAGPLKWPPQLDSTPPALFLSPPPSSTPLLLGLFRVFFFCTICSSACESRPSRSVFTAPSTSSPLYIPYVFTLAFSGKPSRRAPRQYLCCSERRLHFFPPQPHPWHFITLISLPNSSFILLDLFLLCFSSLCPVALN